MATKIACCGLDCAECGAYRATQKNDDAARRQVAEEWSKSFHHDIKAADINCDGCTSVGGRTFSYCGQCAIRTCAQGLGLDNCAGCADYGCEKLSKVFPAGSPARNNLDGARKA
jgi:hypothetical protein